MTTATGMMLVTQIMPLITRAISRGAVKPVGAEDFQELTSEACALAASALESLELRGKEIPIKSVVFYALQRLKSGRRSCGGSMTDPISAGAAVSGKAHISSLDEPCGGSDAGEGSMTLHDMLADAGEGPDEAAARELDWTDLEGGLNSKQREVIRGTSRSDSGMTMAADLGVSSPRITQLKIEIARQVRSRWGNGCIAEISRPPAWQHGITALRERREARFERSKA